MITEESVLKVMKYLHQRIKSVGCVYASDCISRLARSWGAIDTANFFEAVNRLEKEEILLVLRHPQSRAGQHEIYVKYL